MTKGKERLDSRLRGNDKVEHGNDSIPRDCFVVLPAQDFLAMTEWGAPRNDNKV
jgi:hypothetical protein